MDFSNYVTPGVYADAIPGPQIGIQGGAPRSVGIFGLSRGTRTDTEVIILPQDLNEETPNPDYISDPEAVGFDPDTPEFLYERIPQLGPILRRTGIDTSTLTVRSVATGLVYTEGVDFEIVTVPGPSGIVPSDDTSYRLRKLLGEDDNGMDNIELSVSYGFTDQGYFEPTFIYDYSDAVDKYGPAFNSDGTVASELTLAIQFAIVNGASSVVAVAVRNTGSPQVSDYTDALAKLEGVQEVSVVVPATGNSNLFTAVRDHVIAQSAARYERKAILGIDGTLQTVTSQQRIAFAGSIKSARVALVSPSKVKFYNPVTSRVQYLGGQFLAAAIAGLAVRDGSSPALPLTRKEPLGFAGVDPAPETEKVAESRSGLLVVDSINSTSPLRVRHGVTTDTTSLFTREWSVLSQQDAMVFRIRRFFDSDGLIGSIISSSTVASVKASAESALQSLSSEGVISSYRSLRARQLPSNLDVIQVEFEWQPSLPLNYVVARFTLNVSNGSIEDNATA